MEFYPIVFAERFKKTSISKLTIGAYKEEPFKYNEWIED
jgi:hypothetical protein